MKQKQIKSTTIKCLVSILVLLFIPCMLYAYPPTVNFQGNLTNKDGSPIDGSVDMTFTFFDDETSEAPIWTEEHFSVPITKGFFAVKLGSQGGDDLSENLPDDKDIFVSISIAGEQMEGRFKLDSVINAIFSKYSLKAKTVEFNSITSDHIVDRSISSVDIAPNALTVTNIGNKAITQEKLADQSVGSKQIADGSVTSEKISNDLMDELTNKQNGNFITLMAAEQLKGADRPVAVYQDKDGLILEQASGSSNAGLYGVNRAAISFKTDVGTNKLEKIALLLQKTGSPSGIIDVRIYPVDANNHPENAPLVNGMKTNSANDVSDGWNMFEFEFEVTLSPLTTYAIVVSVPEGNNSNYINWKYQNSDVYQDGNYMSCDNYDNNWTDSTSKDFAFKLYSNKRVYACKADDSRKLEFIGFAVSNAEAGENITIQTEGVVNGFSDLDIGKMYYLKTTPGEIGLDYSCKAVAVASSESKVTIYWGLPQIKTMQRATGLGPEYSTDSGQIPNRVLTFNKNQDDTAIRIGYTDNLRVGGSNKACRWEIRVNGQTCPDGSLVYDYYSTQYESTYRSRHVIGYCEGINAGSNEIQVWVGNTPGYSGSDCHTGWSSSRWTIEAEEVY